MRIKKNLAWMMVLILVFSMSLTASAATWEDVDSYEKLSNAFSDTDTEIHILLTGDIVNENLEDLASNEGQTYIIDGAAYSLTDISLIGAGDVVINANLIGDDMEDAITTYEQVSVTVNGNITANYDAIDANDESRIVVNGDVRSIDQDAIDADDKATVTINGNVYGGAGADGVDASDDTVVIVNGDVYGGDGLVDEEGNLNHKTMNDPDGYSDGGAGVEANKNAQVTIKGNVYGGDAYGTYGYAGAGIDAFDDAKVVVSGNSVGGDQIANPETVPVEVTEDDGTSYTTYGMAGDGIYMGNTADVTVGGDAIGGTASGQQAVAGCGVYIELTFTKDISRDPETGESVSETIIPGQVTVKGTANAGESTLDSGVDGVAIYYAIYDENRVEASMFTDEKIEEICTAEDPNTIRDYVAVSAARIIYHAGVPYIEQEDRLSYYNSYIQAVSALASEYDVDTQEITDFEAIVASVPEENLAEFAAAALKSGNEIIKEMSFVIYAVPIATVGELKATTDTTQVGSLTEELGAYFKENYIVETGILDPAVEKSYDAYVAIQEFLSNPSPEGLERIEGLIEDFTDANEELTEEQQAEVAALAGKEDIWDLIGDVFIASYVVATANAYEAYVQTPSAKTAMPFIEYYEVVIDDGINMEAFIPGIEATAELAKVDLPSEKVKSVYHVWSYLDSELQFATEEFLLDGLLTWAEVEMVFKELNEEDLTVLGELMEEPDGVAAKDAVESTVFYAKAMYDVLVAYNDFGETWDKESATAFIELYETIIKAEDADEELVSLIYSNLPDLDDLYTEANVVSAEESGDVDDDSKLPEASGDVDNDSKSPETGDVSMMPMVYLIVVLAFGTVALLRKHCVRSYIK